MNEEVSKFGGENPDLYGKTLIDFFDTTSGHAKNLAFESQVLENDSLKSNHSDLRVYKKFKINGWIDAYNK